MIEKRKAQSVKCKVKAQSSKFLVLSFSFALCALSFALISGCAKREITNIDSKGTNIICFGDSITFGYGVNKGEDYPSVLARMIDIPVINAGIDGDTTLEALKRIKSDVLDKTPLLVIIELSGNDFLRKIPQEITIGNIKEMIERIQARGAMVAIADISAGMFLAEYSKTFSRLAQEKGAIFIPRLLSGIITNPNMKSDALHPNAEGYELIAQRIYNVIAPYLKQNFSLTTTNHYILSPSATRNKKVKNKIVMRETLLVVSASLVATPVIVLSLEKRLQIAYHIFFLFLQSCA